MYINNKHNAERFTSERGETIWELLGNKAGVLDSHSIARVELKAKGSSAKHYHRVAEESYYILSGQARIVIDDEECTMMPGDVVAIPRMATHQIFNDTDELVIFLAVCSPPWTEDCSEFVD